MDLSVKHLKEIVQKICTEERTLISVLYIVTASLLMTLNMIFYPGFVTWKFFASLSIFPAWLIFAVLREKRLKLPSSVSAVVHFAFGIVFLALIMAIVLKERLVGIAFGTAWLTLTAASFGKERTLKKATTTGSRNNRLVPVYLTITFGNLVPTLILTLVSVLSGSYAFAYMLYIATRAFLPLFIFFFLVMAGSLYLVVYLFLLRPVIDHNNRL